MSPTSRKQTTAPAAAAPTNVGDGSYDHDDETSVYVDDESAAEEEVGQDEDREDDDDDDSNNDTDDEDSFGIDDAEVDDDHDDDVWEDDLPDTQKNHHQQVARRRTQGHDLERQDIQGTGSNGNTNVAFNDSLESLLTDLKGKYGSSIDDMEYYDDGVSGVTDPTMVLEGNLVSATTAAVSKLRRSVVKKLKKGKRIIMKKSKKKSQKETKQKKGDEDGDVEEGNKEEVDVDMTENQISCEETSDDAKVERGKFGQGQDTLVAGISIVVDQHHSHSPTKQKKKRSTSFDQQNDGYEQEYKVPARPASYSQRTNNHPSHPHHQRQEQQPEREITEPEISMFEVVPTTPTTYRNKSYYQPPNEDVDKNERHHKQSSRRRHRHKLHRRKSMSDFIPSSPTPVPRSVSGSSRETTSSPMKKDRSPDDHAASSSKPPSKSAIKVSSSSPQRPKSMRGSTHNTWMDIPTGERTLPTGAPPFVSPVRTTSSSMRSRMMSHVPSSAPPRAKATVTAAICMPDDDGETLQSIIVPLKDPPKGASGYGSPRRSKSPSRSTSSSRRRHVHIITNDNSNSGRTTPHNSLRRKVVMELNDLSSPQRKMMMSPPPTPSSSSRKREQQPLSPPFRKESATTKLCPVDSHGTTASPYDRSSRSSSRRTAQNSRSNRGSSRGVERRHSMGDLELPLGSEEQSPTCQIISPRLGAQTKQKVELDSNDDPVTMQSLFLVPPSRKQERQRGKDYPSKSSMQRSRSNDEVLDIMAAETKSANPKAEEENRKLNLLLDSPHGHRKKKSLLASSKKALMKKINQLTHAHNSGMNNKSPFHDAADDKIDVRAPAELVVIPPFAASKKSSELLRGERRQRHRSKSPVKHRDDDDNNLLDIRLNTDVLINPLSSPPFGADDDEDDDPSPQHVPNYPVLQMLEQEVAFNNISVRSRSASTKKDFERAAPPRTMSAKERHKLRHKNKQNKSGDDGFNNSLQSVTLDDNDDDFFMDLGFKSPPRKRLVANIQTVGGGKSLEHPSTPSTVAADSVTATIATPSLSSSSRTASYTCQHYYDDCQVVVELPLNVENDDNDDQDEEDDTIKDDDDAAYAFKDHEESESNGNGPYPCRHSHSDSFDPITSKSSSKRSENKQNSNGSDGGSSRDRRPRQNHHRHRRHRHHHTKHETTTGGEKGHGGNKGRRSSNSKNGADGSLSIRGKGYSTSISSSFSGMMTQPVQRRHSVS